MQKSGILASAAALTLLFAAPQAGAGVVPVVYTGVVSHGTDASQLFGTAGGVLDGQAFTASFGLDDSGGVGSSTYNPPLSSSYAAYPWAAVPVSITINHHTIGFFMGVDASSENHTNSAGAGGVWGVSTGASAFAVDASQDPVLLYDQAMSLFIQSLTDPFVTNFDYHAKLLHTLQPGDTSGGSLSIVERAVTDGSTTYLQDVTADLTPLSVTVGIPEPSTWLLLIGGFGLAGAALRRRRAALAA